MLAKLKDQIKSALVGGYKERLTVLRGLLSESQKIAKEKLIDVNDEHVISAAEKSIKQLTKSIPDFLKANRQDLVDKYEFEIEVLKEFLPKQLSEDEIKELVDKTIKELGAKSIKDGGGRTISYIAKTVPKGTVCLKTVSKFVMEKLN